MDLLLRVEVHHHSPLPEHRSHATHRKVFSDSPGTLQKPSGAPVRREIDQAGDLWRENGLISPPNQGSPQNRHYITTHRFNPLLKRAGLPQILFHDLRHTCATLLLTRNVNPKIVSEMLGHSTIAITLDTYSHVLPNMRDAAAAAMEEALS
jgi:integrase